MSAFGHRDLGEEARRRAEALGLRSAMAPAESRPWTEAHSEAAVARLLEIPGTRHSSAFRDRASRVPGWAQFIMRGLRGPGGDGQIVVAPGEAAFREILDGACFEFDPARIDREVAIVRERAERRAGVPPSMVAEDGTVFPQSSATLTFGGRPRTGVAIELVDAIDARASALGFQGGAAGELLEDMGPLIAEVRRLRAEAPEPRVVPCVAGLVTDRAGRLLLVHTHRGWELPGGRVEPGETWRAAVAREFREETGLSVSFDPGEPRAFDGMPVNGAQYQSIILIARGTADGDPAPERGDACRDARWFAVSEVPLEELSKIATAQIVREWVESVLRWDAPEAPMSPGALIRDLRDIATGKIVHRYRGLCPEVATAGLTSEHARDERCPACDVLRRADQLLDGDEFPPGPSAVEPSAAMLAHLRDRIETLRLALAGVHERRWMDASAAAKAALDEDDAAALVGPAAIDGSVPPPTPVTCTLAPGVTATVLLGSIDGPVLVTHVVMEPGAEVPLELHEEHAEHIVWLAGNLHVCCGERDVRVNGAFLVPSGVEHTIRNASPTERAEYISIMRRVAPEGR